jgi:hypothetical protein
VRATPDFRALAVEYHSAGENLIGSEHAYVVATLALEAAS